MKRITSIALALSLAITAIPASAESTATIAAQPGDESGAVQSVQTRLTMLGYYDGDVTARYGERTASAVKQFETDFGLAVDGILTDAEYEVLMSTDYRTLTYGSHGADVKRLQTRLASLGYYKGKMSGNYLEGTQAAVKAFQEKMGLVITGDADAALQALLYSSDARFSRQNAIKGSTTPTPEPQEVLEVPDGDDPNAGILEAADTPSPTVSFPKTLKKGSTGEDVKKVQQRLTDLMYYTGPISGNYQDKTVAAVKRFQTQNGVKATGQVDEKTWNLLFNNGDIVPPDATPCPTPEPTPEPDPAFYVVVDVTNQAVLVYGRDESGEYNQLVRKMICSSGTKSNPSTLGTHKISGRKTTWCYFPAWGDYARYWTQITPSIAFHSVIYMKVDTMSLSQKSYRNLGSRASHGCIRLLVSEAKWIYDNVSGGTLVTITESLPSDPELKASLKQPALNTKNMLPVETPRPTMEPMYVSGALPPMPLTKLDKNSSSEAVWWLQKKLTELGYYSGNCSGTYKDGTANAVKAFQRDHGIRVTGTADVKTLEAIYADELAMSQLTTPAPGTPAPIATPAPQTGN